MAESTQLSFLASSLKLKVSHPKFVSFVDEESLMHSEEQSERLEELTMSRVTRLW